MADRSEIYKKWLSYERELLMNRPGLRSFAEENLPLVDAFLVVSFPREKLLQFRANYALLLTTVCDFAGIDPDTTGPLELIAKLRAMDLERAEMRERLAASEPRP